MKEYIYLDHAASTPVCDIAFKAALPYYKDIFYNPASSHALGQTAAGAVERARRQCASAIGCEAGEIIFVSGGTEAINQAMSVDLGGKKRIAISALEHDAVFACAKRLEERGVTVDIIPSDGNGTVTEEALRKTLTDDTALVCVMAVNNIVGTVQPIEALCDVAHRAGALFFTDAVQAVNSAEIDVKKWGVDFLAVSGHKLYGPKGSGFLYVSNKANPTSFIAGGSQERGLRGGTVDVPAVVGLGEAVELAVRDRQKNVEYVKTVRDAFLGALKTGRPLLFDSQSPEIVSVVFDGINGGRLAVALSCAGVCCSVGSACSAGSATPPHTLVAMGVEGADRAVRFSFGRAVTAEQARTAANIVNDVVKKLS